MRIEEIRIRNFRAFRDVTIKNIGGFGVFIGPNGSGKSTLFEALKFLKDAVTGDLTKAVDARGGFDAILSQGADRPEISFEIQFDGAGENRIFYTLAFENSVARAVVKTENLACGEKKLIERIGNKLGVVNISSETGELEDFSGTYGAPETDRLALKILGAFGQFKEIRITCDFIENWFFFAFNNSPAREPQIGVGRYLLPDGRNLALYIRNIQENHPEIFKKIIKKLSQRVPGIESADALKTEDDRVILRFKENAHAKPFLAKYISDGTLTILACLALLYGPKKYSFIAIDEPELTLFPHLLSEFAEELEVYSKWDGQVFVTTHSPELLNAVPLEAIYAIEKKAGSSRVHRLEDNEQFKTFVDAGEKPGDLWKQTLVPGSNLQ